MYKEAQLCNLDAHHNEQHDLQGDREILIYPQSDLLSRAEQACSFLKAATAILCAANACSLSKSLPTSGAPHSNLLNIDDSQACDTLSKAVFGMLCFLLDAHKQVKVYCKNVMQTSNNVLSQCRSGGSSSACN